MDISREVGLLLFETVRYLVECRNDVKLKTCYTGKMFRKQGQRTVGHSGPSIFTGTYIHKEVDNNEIGGSKRLKGCVCVVPGTYHTF